MYEKTLHDPKALGIVITYPNENYRKNGKMEQSTFLKAQESRTFSMSQKPSLDSENMTVGIIGAGNFARSILLPALARTKANLAAVADINGVAAAHAALKFGAEKAVSDYRLLLDDPGIRAVFIVVGHHLHAEFVCEALKAGKHVFVEKPLALNEAELIMVEEAAARAPDRLLMVGFNRRFSPHIVTIKKLLDGRTEPLCMTMTVNSGFIPPEHWAQDPQRGGGRIIGEGCHFFDLLSHLTGSPIRSVFAAMLGGSGPIREDKISTILSFADGSIGTVNYFANGSKSYPKETLEVFGNGRVIRMENFRITKGYGFKGFRSFRTWRQDKGHRAEISAFVKQIALGGAPLIPFDQLANITRASFAAVESARSKGTIHLKSE